mmetsp:Transcript_18917/g.53349  ORF Transcript_18917/g.53349 Transcript_18917/m.53349 type:complete len:112 (+) Transcript_18917:3-338(+)
MLNVALWTERASRAWCAWQLNVYHVVQSYIPQLALEPSPFFPDKLRFPKGVPVAFYFCHQEKRAAEAAALLEKVVELNRSGAALKPYFFIDRFYSTAADLMAAHPNLGCVL